MIIEKDFTMIGGAVTLLLSYAVILGIFKWFKIYNGINPVIFCVLFMAEGFRHIYTFHLICKQK